MKTIRTLTTHLFALGALAGIGLMPLCSASAAPEPPEKVEKGAQPYRGKVGKVDTSARTLTVGGQLIYVTDATKLTKQGQAITLYDVMPNDEVHGTTRQTFDGKTEAVTVMVGPDEGNKEKQKDR